MLRAEAGGKGVRERRLRQRRHVARPPRHHRAGSLWQEKVKLDDNFLRSLRDHPVPVREEALRIIGTKSMAIDIYIWLAYRLHVLSKPTPISWLSLHNQFGGGFAQVKHFKPTFNDALTLAMAVYPEARVDIEVEGLVLHPSPPAIPKVEMARLGLG
ncbi:replication protein RepA (plasmid) [Roseomonas mucosa]|nr:replication protein RepA [Roseomonas mucosa]